MPNITPTTLVDRAVRRFGQTRLGFTLFYAEVNCEPVVTQRCVTQVLELARLQVVMSQRSSRGRMLVSDCRADYREFA